MFLTINRVSFLLILTYLLITPYTLKCDPVRGFFIENIGQITPPSNPTHSVDFFGKSNSLQFHISKQGIQYYQFFIQNKTSDGEYKDTSRSISTNKCYRTDIFFNDYNHDCKIIKKKIAPDPIHYFNINDNGTTASARKYSEVIYKDLWKGVDLIYFYNSGELETEWHINNPSDYKRISFTVQGCDLKIIGDTLVMSNPFGIIKEGALYVFQNGVKKPAKWILSGNTVSFDIDSLVPGEPVIIDPPVIAWSTYFGSTGSDQFFSNTKDYQDNIIAVGLTNSTSLIATSGSHQQSIGGGEDGLIVKFDKEGNRLWSTYYGGSGSERFNGCDVDSLGNIYAVGYSNSTNQIATLGSHQVTKSVGNDGILIKFSTNGIRQWGTYLGGNGDDRIHFVHCFKDKVYLTGSTTSSNQISTAGSHQSLYAGGQDCFLSQFNSNGALLWSTYVGGSAADGPWEVQSDSLGNIYLCGITRSTNGISSPSSFQPSYGGGGWNAFLVKFNSSGNRIWGTYFGASSSATTLSLSNNSIFLAGYTSSTSQIAHQAFQSSFAGGSDDAFLAKFDLDGNREWATYYGGSGLDIAYSCRVDPCGKNLIILSGLTQSSNNMVSSNATQTQLNGNTDGFVAVFDMDGNRMYGSYWGGNGNETPRGGAYGRGNFAFSGFTSSNSGIATQNAFQVNNNGGNDGFVSSINILPNYDFPVYSINGSLASSNDSFLWNQNNSWYKTEGVYRDTLFSSNRCIVVYELELSLSVSYYNVYDTAHFCSSFLWGQNNATYTQAGDYVDTIKNTGGLDTIMHIHLIQNMGSFVEQNIITCSLSYFWPENNKTYYESGYYCDTTRSSEPYCDSISCLALQIIDYSDSFNIIALNDSLCLPAEVVFEIHNQTNLNYQWEFNFDNQPMTGDQNNNTGVLIFSNDSMLTENVRIITENQCTAEIPFPKLSLFPRPTAQFLYSPELPELNQNIQFSNTSIGANSYKWTIPPHGNFFVPNPTVRYTENDTGFFNVQLIAFNEFNCSDTATKDLYILPTFQYYIPNVFNPKSSFNNNTFRPVVTGGRVSRMQIFNRWGEKLFDQENVQSWDGKYNEKQVPHGAYIYILTIQNNVGSKKEIAQGFFQVIP